MSNRLDWVDNAKTVGILLVFYGHLAEIVYGAGVQVAFYPFKFIYTFHVPFFFFIAGFFWRPATDPWEHIKKLAFKRIIPVFTFGILLLPFWLLREWQQSGTIHWFNLGWKTLGYFHGTPNLNWITWFLVCLFSCELLAMVILPKIRTPLFSFLLGIIVLISGLIACQHLPVVVRIFGILQNTWYIHEAVVALGFYTLGYALFNPIKSLLQRRPTVIYPIGLFALGMLWFTYLSNAPTPNFVPLLALSLHGETMPFIIAALTGILFTLCLAIAIPTFSIVTWIGQNTLILIGLNGLFFHFLNPFLITQWLPNNTLLSVHLYCTLGTFASLIVCIPLIKIINRYIPRWVGDTASPKSKLSQ
jgi:fucose 4-O-acetylase-like acetyltransferase